MVEKTIELTGISANSVEGRPCNWLFSRARRNDQRHPHRATSRISPRTVEANKVVRLEGENQSDFPGERRASRVNESAAPRDAARNQGDGAQGTQVHAKTDRLKSNRWATKIVEVHPRYLRDLSAAADAGRRSSTFTLSIAMGAWASGRHWDAHAGEHHCAGRSVRGSRNQDRGPRRANRDASPYRSLRRVGRDSPAQPCDHAYPSPRG